MTMAQLSYIVTIIAIALTCILAQEYYSDQYDDIDAVGILENDKLRDQYYKCFMDLGPCQTADAKFFKGFFMEAFQTKCSKCTEKQKRNLDLIVEWYTKNRPADWEAFISKSLEDLKKKNARR